MIIRPFFTSNACRNVYKKGLTIFQINPNFYYQLSNLPLYNQSSNAAYAVRYNAYNVASVCKRRYI